MYARDTPSAPKHTAPNRRWEEVREKEKKKEEAGKKEKPERAAKVKGKESRHWWQ